MSRYQIHESFVILVSCYILCSSEMCNCFNFETMSYVICLYCTGSYRGLVNSRSSSSKISHDLPKHSAWLPDGGFCGEPSIWTDYTKFHQSVLIGQQPGKYLMYECTSGDCGGYGNRMQSITTLLMLAMLTK